MEAQLPEDYKEVFKSKRHKKNEKLARYLHLLNFNNLALDVLNEETDPVNLQFNVEKTYIEYLNRVVGVITGIFVFITFIYSFSFIGETWIYTFLSFINLVLVGFQGWIGSLVVSTDLLPAMVTVHMLLTVLILALIIFMVYKVSVSKQAALFKGSKALMFLLIISVSISIVQMALGTQVREEIDMIAKTFKHVNKGLWIDQLGLDFIIHRSFSWLVLVINIILVYIVYRRFRDNSVYIKLANTILVFIVIELIAGILLAYFAIPAVIQPIHLFLAFVIFSIQFLFFINNKF